MPAEAGILHSDADAFFASVEQRDDPRLRGRPVAVGGGVVTAASYEARAFGVRGGMGGAEARRLCPELVFAKPRWSAYVEASRALFEVFAETAPAVEGISLEEAFLDARGLEHVRGSPLGIALRLKREALERVGLPVTVGIARTKSVAKMASRLAKPDGLLAVPAERELDFLHPLPVGELWGVGPATAEKLNASGLETVGDVAARAEHELVAIVGRAAGRKLHALANGRDPRRVNPRRSRRSFGSQSALGRRRRSREELEATVLALADRVARRMRAAGRAGRTIALRLRFGDYRRATRSLTLPQPTADTETIRAVASALLGEAMPIAARRGLTLVGIAVSNLSAAGVGVQLALPLERRPRDGLDAALDELRDRFGPAAVTRGSLLGRDPGLSAWLLPRNRRRRR
ncbi:MAG TPA: DNA polymerase IV [Solirubrobacterales bacterium]|nr:DNA polymerase IV [Solirubrobacterales bacterium]